MKLLASLIALKIVSNTRININVEPMKKLEVANRDTGRTYSITAGNTTETNQKG